MSAPTRTALLGRGDVVAGCELVDVIGRGGSGVVFRAVERPLARAVAVKVLDAPTTNAGAAARFRREAEAAARIAHPNVLPLFRVAEDQEQLVLVMQYVPGGTLYDLLRAQGAPPFGAALSIIEQVASALDAGHALGIIHRDVKPQNVLMGHGGHVWLADFGTARLVRDDSAVSLTNSGQVVGTVDYMPPEQIEGRAVGPSADVYGLGCVAYRLLTGRVPFPGDSVVARMYAHLNSAPPDPCALRADLPAAIGREVARALAKEAPDRHESAGAFARALQEAWRGSAAYRQPPAPVAWGALPRLGSGAAAGPDGDHTMPDDPAPVHPRSPRDRNARALAPLVLLVAAGLAAGATLSLIRGAEPGPVVGDAGVSVESPSGWEAATASPAMATLGLADEPAAAAGSGAQALRLATGPLGPVQWPDLLPADWSRRGTAGPVQTELPEAPGVRGILWRGIPAGDRYSADAVIVASATGARGAVCVGPLSTPAADRAACISAAQHLTLGDSVDAVPPVPSPAYAMRAQSALGIAASALDRVRAAVDRARTNAGQRTAVLALAASAGRAIVALGRAEPGLQGEHTRMRRALDGVRRAARGLAAAAAASDGAAWDAERQRLESSTERLRRAAKSLAGAGYRVEGGT